MQKIMVFLLFATTVGFGLMACGSNNESEKIIAISSDSVSWKEAVYFCEQRNGKLPRIIVQGKPNEFLYSDGNRLKSERMEYFGKYDASWPANLQLGWYWSGTSVEEYSFEALAIFPTKDGSFDFINVEKQDYSSPYSDGNILDGIPKKMLALCIPF